MMKNYSTVVIGGGAAGICAAISKARSGESVIICEKMTQLGKKILASGNGRCNLLNDKFDESCYNPASGALVKSVLCKFGKSAILDFFHTLGLETWSQDGRIFPVTNQAASMLKVLEMELKRLSVPVEYNFDCLGILILGNDIIVSSKNGDKITCRKVIITGGGKSYPVLGSDGSIYNIARQLGHTIVEPVPSAVPLVVKDSLCHYLQGQRIIAGAGSIINGKQSAEVRGELLFTKYGLSGTCVLDVSEEISIALNRHHQKDVLIAIDMVPFLDKEQLKARLIKRKKEKVSPDEMLVGILPNKFCVALKDIFEKSDIDAAVNYLKDMRFKVSATKSWNEAEFTAGGIAVDEVVPGTLESKLCKGIYFAGEVLDVNGKRGGYNLGWAWASGFVAGQTL
jgi:predicted Rossmann fold flavoprotein